MNKLGLTSTTHFLDATTQLRLQQEATSANQNFAANMQTQTNDTDHEKYRKAIAARATTPPKTI